MSRRSWAWVVALAVLTGLVAATAPAFPAEGEAEPPPASGETAGMPDDSTVEKILRQQQDLLTGQRFSYDPSGRRDPFRSLMEEVKIKKDPKLKGIRGMVISEIDLTGIVKDGSDGNMALLMGSDNKGYFLRVGDPVFDGTLIGIDPRIGTVTFRQKINDPRRIKPYQDIVKTLVALDEESTR